MSPHDQALVEKAKAITNPVDWCLVPDENEAESQEVKEFLHRRSSYLYHCEEGELI